VLKMARISLEIRSRVINLHRSSFKLKDIQLNLKEEDICISNKSLFLLLKKYRIHGVVSDLPRLAKRRKLSLQHLKFIDEAITEDDEISTSDLHGLLQEAGLNVSLSTVQRAIRFVHASYISFLVTVPGFGEGHKQDSK